MRPTCWARLWARWQSSVDSVERSLHCDPVVGPAGRFARALPDLYIGRQTGVSLGPVPLLCSSRYYLRASFSITLASTRRALQVPCLIRPCSASLQDPNQQARIAQTVWGPFARLDLVETADPNTKLLFTDGGAGSYMIRFDGDLTKVNDLRTDPDYLSFAMAPATDTLYSWRGRRQGRSALAVRRYRTLPPSSSTRALLTLPANMRAFNGNILDRPA